MKTSLKVSQTNNNSDVSKQNELISVDEMQRVGNTQLIVKVAITCHRDFNSRFRNI